TPAYMSPEQVNGDPNLGAGTDIYSLGVILYELLTGSLPFDGNPAMLLALILTQDPPPPSSRRTDLDPKLDPTCRPAMAHRPVHRLPIPPRHLLRPRFLGARLTRRVPPSNWSSGHFPHRQGPPAADVWCRRPCLPSFQRLAGHGGHSRSRSWSWRLFSVPCC